MSASTAIADSRLQQASADKLVPRALDVLLHVRLDPSGLRVPVSQCDFAISSVDDARDPELVDGSLIVMSHTG